MNPFLCTFLCTYALVKDLFGCTDDFKQSGDLKTFFLRCLVIIVTLLVYTLVGCLLLVFFILHHLVDAYLRINLGPAYGGMLKRQDALLESLKDKSVVRAVCILNQHRDQSDVWRSCLVNARKFHSSSYKLSSHVESCLGYAYYLKDQTKFEDVVEEVTIGSGDYITKEELLDYINNVLRTKHDEKRLWSLHYFAQPIYWNHKSNTTKQYVGVLSFNHSLSDGPNFMKHVMEHLLDKGPYKPPQSNVVLNNLKNTPKLSIDDAYICNNPLNTSTDEFPKLYKNIDDDAYTAIYSEDTERYLNLIKQVKTKIGVGFNSVLIGALSSSLTDYLKKKNKPPMDLTLLNIIQPEEINLVFKSNDEGPLINDLGHQTIKTMYMMSKFVHIIPSVLQRLGLRPFWLGLNSIFTNMSSLKNLAFGGHVLEGAFFFVSNLPLAFTFCVTSLNGRLQLTLHASGLYVSNRKELQDILDGTLEYIDKFLVDLQIS